MIKGGAVADAKYSLVNYNKQGLPLRKRLLVRAGSRSDAAMTQPSVIPEISA